MSWLSGTSELVTGGWLSSAYPGLGATGAVIVAAGALGDHGPGVGLNDGLLNGSEYLFEVATQPAGGTVVLTELGQVTLTVPADGAYNWSYRLREDGVYQSPNPVTVSVTVGVVVLTGAAANCSQANASAAVSGSVNSSTITGAAANCSQVNTSTVVAGSTGLFQVSAARTFRVPKNLPMQFGNFWPDTQIYWGKYPNDVLDYSIDWTDFLELRTIVNASVEVIGDIVVGYTRLTGAVHTAVVGAGTPGKCYVIFKAELLNGLRVEQHIAIEVR